MKQTLVAVLSVLLPLTALPDDGFRVSYGAVPYLKRLELRLRYTFPFKNKTLINQANQFFTSILSPKLPKLLRKERGQPSTK